MEDARDGRTMQIGELAERAGLSLHTLRHWDEVGLLKPSVRSDGGFRLYTEDDLSRLLVIRRMKPLGFSLEEMADVMAVVEELPTAGADRARALRARLAEVVTEAEQRRTKLETQLAMADEFIGLLRSQ
ncbi:MerR family transcriptional regulator [Cellulomonas endophytica]|uniref:MerR family transcriptional regulator n=1 Tax=Cellulomonas endophytica TaxID=2494735 RepID=UPI001010D3D2|nr:MerR family transcriptional regulator [Cellulomonas endophytica]